MTFDLFLIAFNLFAGMLQTMSAFHHMQTIEKITDFRIWWSMGWVVVHSVLIAMLATNVIEAIQSMPN